MRLSKPAPKARTAYDVLRAVVVDLVDSRGVTQKAPPETASMQPTLRQLRYSVAARPASA